MTDLIGYGDDKARNDSVLEQMRAKTRAKGKDPKVTKKVWVEPTLEDFAPGRYLAFDQTLTKTGWSLVTVRDRITVICGLLLCGDSPLKSNALTLWRAEVMGDLIEDRMNISGAFADEIIHEQPFAARGMGRNESSLMGAREVQRAHRRYYPGLPLTTIQRRSAYATLLGKPDAPKSEMTAFVERWIAIHDRIGTRWNQDIHDSIGLALKRAYDKKREAA